VSALQAVRCKQCGGAVASVPGKPLPVCLFCGAAGKDLVPFDPPEQIEPPVGAIPFAVEEAAATAAFEKFATSSWWYPSDLRNQRLELKRLLLPAWAWAGVVETHWTGLVKAPGTRSGKRPISGSEQREFPQVLVPASRSLTRAELTALGRYDEDALGAFDPDRTKDPYELSELTRSVARQHAVDEMERRHAAVVQKEHAALTIRASSILHRLDGKPVLVPVWIGAYRYGDKVHRILVNGQTGQLWGTAPKSLWKQLFVAVLVLALITFLLMCCGGFGGCAALVGGSQG
jgi:hypothetical protein